MLLASRVQICTKQKHEKEATRRTWKIMVHTAYTLPQHWCCKRIHRLSSLPSPWYMDGSLPFCHLMLAASPEWHQLAFQLPFCCSLSVSQTKSNEFQSSSHPSQSLSIPLQNSIGAMNRIALFRGRAHLICTWPWTFLLTQPKCSFWCEVSLELVRNSILFLFYVHSLLDT